MTSYKILFGCLSFCFVFAQVIGEPAVCYYCTTDADGTSCNDPANTNNIRYQHCGNFSVTDSFDSTDMANSTSSTNGTYVCATFTYTSTLNTFVTIRECQSRLVSGVDICTYLGSESITNSYSRNFTCQTCNTNLCNYSNDGGNGGQNLRFSLIALLGIVLMKLVV